MGSSVSPPMKVAMVVPCLSRAGGGLFDSVRRLAQEVHALPNNDVCAVGCDDEFTLEDLPTWAPVDADSLKRFGPEVLGFAPSLRRALARRAPNVLHQHGLWTLNSLEVLRFVRAAPRTAPQPSLVISTHGMADRWAVNQSKTKKAIAWYTYQRRQLQCAQCIIVASPAEGQTLRDEGILQPIAVIPNGVDVPAAASVRAPWHDQLSADRRVLLFLGRIHRKKGLLPLLRAWARAITRNRALFDNWSLVVTGWDDGGHEPELRAVARELGLTQTQFCITGPLFGPDRDSALAHAHALVLPSLSEGMPMSVLEGMAHGLPVLISDACNLPQVLAHSAGLRANPTQSSLELALDTLAAMTDSERQRMGASGKHLATTSFSWQAIAWSTQQVYNWVCQGEQGPNPKPDLPWI